MVNIICLNCNKEFVVNNYKAKEAKYCCKQCQIKHKQAPTTICICLKCGKEFTRLNWELKASYKGMYCSKECYFQRSPQQEVQCPCGKRFKAHQSRISYYGILYCNKSCYQQYGFFGRLIEEGTELNNYEKFTRSLRHTAKYLQWKKSCLERDAYKCISCNATTDLTVHHKISLYDLVKQHGLNKEKIETDSVFIDISNGETLCRSCHLKSHMKGTKDEQDN